MKNIIEENEKITVNTKEIEILKKYFPNCFNKNGEFQMDKFEKRISKEVDVTKEGYELRWLGKNYARLLANIETETMIVDDEEHNNKRENKNSENIYIEGDNIDVLKHLKNAYSEKIKMIYIDPPYNTGSDGFVYKDDRKYTKEDLAELTNITEEEAQRILSFNTKGSNSHSAWLTFMYPRLLTARELLSDDGVIFISIDDNEVSQLKLLCDEVFGEENFVAEFIWRKKKESSNDAELTITNSDNSIKKLKIRFIDKLKSININESSYFLNTEYYLYLKKNLNISELVDLLDDFLQEDIYQINDLKFIKSKTKYRNNKFRILNAKMKTVNSQNENLITNWQIFYSYNKNNILTSVKQKTKDEVRYTKILISNISNVLSYQIYWQVDERFSDDKKETFDITQNAYCEKGTYLQIGLNREEDYEKRITKSIYQTSSTLELSKNEIIRILKEMAQKNN